MKNIKLSKREARILSVLLSQPLKGWEIEKQARVRYAPSAMQHLAEKGILIISTMIPWVDEDGDKRDIAIYSIDPESVDLVLSSLD